MGRADTSLMRMVRHYVDDGWWVIEFVGEWSWPGGGTTSVFDWGTWDVTKTLTIAGVAKKDCKGAHLSASVLRCRYSNLPGWDCAVCAIFMSVVLNQNEVLPWVM